MKFQYNSLTSPAKNGTKNPKRCFLFINKITQNTIDQRPQNKKEYIFKLKQNKTHNLIPIKTEM